MFPNHIRDFITSNFLRLNEEMDEYGLKDMGSGFFEVPIVKRTAKRRRKTREILLNAQGTTSPMELQKLSKNFTSTGVKRNWTNEEGDPLVQSGALMRLIDFRNDEKSIKDMYYVMGYELYQFIKEKEKGEQEELNNELQTLMNRYDEFKEVPTLENMTQERLSYLLKIQDLFEQIISSVHKDNFKIPSNWRKNKQILFLHFLLAFYLQIKTKSQFDWKEIGANYYSKIGGSKKFDSVKKDFLDLLEELDFPPVSIAGLLSLGTITILPFSGPLVGSMSQFQYGTVHSLTDHEVFSDQFSTTATNLWLVENRGIITRFAYEKDFLKNTNSLVIGVEGQLKSSVKRLIRMVSQSESINQIIIWTDYDEAGLMIAKHIYELLLKERNQNAIIKWIVPEQPRVANDIPSYEQITKEFLSKNKAEQEEKMEGVDEWLRWIKK